MAYDSLKALIRQYIKTNGEQEITGQILQNVLVEMVNQYPSTDGYATQSWVTSQLAGYATTTQLAGYLPLTGGTLSGNLTVSNAYMSVVTADSSSTSYTTIIRGPGIEAQMMSSGIPIYRMVLDYGGLTFYDQNVAGTTITRSSITSGSFIKSGGTAAQFLKADGSVDSNTYVTSSVLSGYLPLTGGTLTGVLNFASGGINRGVIFGDEYGLSIQIAGTTGKLFIENAIEADSTIKTEGFIKNGGTSAQFLKADGSVDSNAYITSATLADYLPLTGGTLSGNLTVLNANVSVVTADSSSTSYTTIIRGPGIEAQMMRSGTPIYRMVLDYSGLTFYDNDVAGTTITRSNITSGSFIKSGGTAAQFLKADGSVDSNTYVTSSVLSGYLPLTGGTLTGVLNFASGGINRGVIFGDEYGLSIQIAGTTGKLFIENAIEADSTIKTEGFIKNGGTSSQFLKADGSVDSNTYITASALSGYATQSWVTTQLGSYNPTTNFKTINNQSIIGTGNINIEGGGGTLYDAEIEYLESTGTQHITIDYYSNNNTDIYCEVEYKTFDTYKTPDVFGNDGYILLSHWSAGPSIIGEFRGMTTSGFGIGQSPINIGHKYIIHANKDTFLIDTTDHCSTPSTASFVCPNKFQIFGLAGVNYSHPSIKIYRFIIKEGDSVLFDLIPVRVGNVGYLYDKVSGELFGNSGTGDFVLGQDTGPGGGLPYLPLTGGTITGNLTVDGAVKFNSNLTFANGRGINFGTDDDDVYIKREYSRLLIINEAGNDIIIGDYDNRKFTSIVNDLQGGTTDSTYRSVTQKWLIRHDGDAYFKSVSQTSDLRKKTITGDVPMNLYNVANAPLFKFTWNDEKKYSGQHIGSAAQYWQTVLPELVSIGRDADMTLAMQYDVIALASAITVAKTVVNHEERIILLERENEALKKEIADLKSA